MLYELLACVFGGTLLLYAIWAYFQGLNAIKKMDRKCKNNLKKYPSITVIRPIKGLDAGVRENIRAALDTAYPGKVESIFVFDDNKEPALPIVRRELKASLTTINQRTSKIIFCGEPSPRRTGKLNAMIVGLKEATSELIAFADSDVREDKDSLTSLVETLVNSKEAGSAFAPVVVSSEVKTIGDVGYALIINGLYGPSAAAVTRKNGGELPFIMGQYMVFTREAIEAIGGLECAEGQLVDDMYLGTRITAAGYRNMVSPHPVSIIQQGLSLKGFWKIYIKWITFSRSGLPSGSFKLVSWLKGTAFWLGVILTAISFTKLWWPAILLASCASFVIAATINSHHKAFGGAELKFNQLWGSFGIIFIAPFVYLSIFTKHEVTWRGRTYQLNAQSKLAAE